MLTSRCSCRREEAACPWCHHRRREETDCVCTDWWEETECLFADRSRTNGSGRPKGEASVEGSPHQGKATGSGGGSPHPGEAARCAGKATGGHQGASPECANEEDGKSLAARRSKMQALAWPCITHFKL